MSEVRVIESASVWERIRETISKPAFIISAVIGALILAVVVTLIVIFAGGGSISDVAIDYSKALLVSDERDLWALDLGSQEKSVLLKSSKGIAAFDLLKKNTIYWREFESNYVNSLSKKYHNLTQSREWNPISISVDFVTENVYVLDVHAGKINVYDPKSTKYGIVVSDLKNPIDMAIDSLLGLLFVSQKSDSILKGNMDGTSFTKIITSPSVTSICVDTQTPKLYWSDAEKLESSDYDGNKRTTVAHITSSTLSLGVSGNRLFWTKPADASSTLRTLWSCTMNDGICNDADIQQIAFDDPKNIKVYTGEVPTKVNPCEISNGGCQQLCLLTTDGGHSCACFVGYQLKGDSKNCETVNEYILYTRGDFIRGRIMDSNKQTFNDAILPIKFNHSQIREKETIDFDYNYHTNTFIFSDDQSINTLNLAKEEPQGTYSREKCLKYVSYDWVTNDVYYIKDTCYTSENTTIILLKPKENSYFWKTLHTFNWSTGNRRSLVVHPNKGCYFFTVLLKGIAKIYKVHSKVMPFIEEDVNEIGLTIDPTEDRLYWFSQDTMKLHSVNLEGVDKKSIDVSIIHRPRSVSIHDRYAYVANLTSIWRFDKLTGSGAIRLVPRFEDDDVSGMISGVKVFSKSVQPIDSNNPCAIQNGNCQQFCFREPRKIVSGGNSINVTDELQKVCLCEDYKTIQADGSTCTEIIRLWR